MAAGSERIPSGAEERESSIRAANRLIRSLQEPDAFWDSFQRVMYDSLDSEEYSGARVVVIVAKGECADRLADAYEAEL